MQDMLVHLRKVPSSTDIIEKLKTEDIRIIRALAPDKVRVLEWIKTNSSVLAYGEADACFSNTPTSLFLAVKDKNIIGYACYDAIAPNFFGPTRVLEEFKGKGIGKALLLRSLEAMRDGGYVYGIIGGVGPAEFYTKCVGATLIEGSTPGIYEDMLGKE